MLKVWDHIEHLAPGLALAVLFMALVPAGIGHSFKMPSGADGLNLTLAQVPIAIAFAYLLGVINSSLARLLFTEAFGIMDWFRWRYLAKLCTANPKLRDAVLHLRDLNSWDELLQSFRNEQISAWQVKRDIFHQLLGASDNTGGKQEISDRRREARLLRAAVFPIMAWCWIVVDPIEWPWGWLWFALAFVAVVTAYLYRECNIADTFERYAHLMIPAASAAAGGSSASATKQDAAPRRRRAQPQLTDTNPEAPR